jgi:pyruvate/2-oxoglutarate dehydrogenase complex dihydrolipoamide dehydrogenase (E3) component
LLLQQVRPSDWINPQPAPRYHLVVLGGGTAGLVTAAAAAGLGARVALVEAGLMGETALYMGAFLQKRCLLRLITRPAFIAQPTMGCGLMAKSRWTLLL